MAHDECVFFDQDMVHESPKANTGLYRLVGLDLVHIDHVDDHISLNCGTLIIIIDFLVENHTLNTRIPTCWI